MKCLRTVSNTVFSAGIKTDIYDVYISVRPIPERFFIILYRYIREYGGIFYTEAERHLRFYTPNYFLLPRFRARARHHDVLLISRKARRYGFLILMQTSETAGQRPAYIIEAYSAFILE